MPKDFSENILEVNQVSKLYRLGLVGTGTLKDDIQRTWAKFRGKEDPFLKIGETNIRSQEGGSDYVWALKDITFNVPRGQVVGIIGKNGAGKSTLLKILSQITLPTQGHIRSYGRVAALLEVGTGFHPELTGKENIFLNGAIMGMTKSEIRSKLDQIVDFSGTKRYIDTPVKRYSSGMRVRLGFAVAAHLEPEILIVDEVLAVGDAEFQKKAIGKMQDVSAQNGRTVLFVSHNMAAVKSLCDKVIILEDGKITFHGDTDEGILKYLKGESNVFNLKFLNKSIKENLSITEIGVRQSGKQPTDPIYIEQNFEVFLKLSIKKPLTYNCHIALHIKDENGNFLFETGSKPFNYTQDDIFELLCQFPKNLFNTGTFWIDLYIIENGKKPILSELDVLNFILLEEARELGTWYGKSKGSLRPKLKWNIHRN